MMACQASVPMVYVPLEAGEGGDAVPMTRMLMTRMLMTRMLMTRMLMTRMLMTRMLMTRMR